MPAPARRLRPSPSRPRQAAQTARTARRPPRPAVRRRADHRRARASRLLTGSAWLLAPGRRVRHRRRPRRRSARRTPGCSAASSGRGSAPPAELEDPRRRGSPRPSAWASPSSALVGAALGADPGLPASRPASRWPPPSSTPPSASAWAARSTCYPPLPPRLIPTRHDAGDHPHEPRHDVLVDADWVEAHLDDPKVVLVEVDEDTTAYDKGHITGAVKLDWTTDLQDPVRRDFVNKAQFEALLSAQGHRQRRHRRALRRQQQLVRRLRLLVLQALRPPGRQAARRRPQEVGARLPRARHRRAPPRAGDVVHREGAGHARSAPSATRSSPRSASKNLVDVRSPDEYAGRLLAPAHLPQEQAQRAGHIPTAANIPWSKAANDDGTFKSDDELTELYADAGVDLAQGHHRLLPHRRALGAHLVRAARAARPAERARTTTARGPSTARWSACPSQLGDEPAAPRRRLMCGATDGRPRRSTASTSTKEAVVQGVGRPRRRAGRRRLRAAARPQRRVHRRGADVGDRALPVLRGARGRGRCAPSRPGPSRSTARSSPQQGVVAEVEITV